MYELTSIAVWLIQLGATVIISWIYQGDGETLIVAPILATISLALYLYVVLNYNTEIPFFSNKLARKLCFFLANIGFTIAAAVPYAYSHFPGSLVPPHWYWSPVIAVSLLLLHSFITIIIKHNRKQSEQKSGVYRLVPQ